MKISKRLQTISALVAAAAAAVAAVVGYFVWRESKAERLDKEYKAYIEDIGRFHEERLSARTLLKNLNDVIDQKTGGDDAENQKLKEDVAAALIDEFESAAFDFKQARNLELDEVALANWKQYKDALIKNPTANINILLNYFHALGKLHDEDPRFVETAMPSNDGGMDSQVAPTVKANDILLRDLHGSYSQHVELLKQSLTNKTDSSNGENLRQAFCWYYKATHNRVLPQRAFGYYSTAFQACSP